MTSYEEEYVGRHTRTTDPFPYYQKSNPGFFTSLWEVLWGPQDLPHPLARHLSVKDHSPFQSPNSESIEFNTPIYSSLRGSFESLDLSQDPSKELLQSRPNFAPLKQNSKELFNGQPTLKKLILEDYVASSNYQYQGEGPVDRWVVGILGVSGALNLYILLFIGFFVAVNMWCFWVAGAVITGYGASRAQFLSHMEAIWRPTDPQNPQPFSSCAANTCLYFMRSSRFIMCLILNLLILPFFWIYFQHYYSTYVDTNPHVSETED